VGKNYFLGSTGGEVEKNERGGKEAAVAFLLTRGSDSDVGRTKIVSNKTGEGSG